MLKLYKEQEWTTHNINESYKPRIIWKKTQKSLYYMIPFVWNTKTAKTEILFLDIGTGSMAVHFVKIHQAVLRLWVLFCI